MNKNHEFCIETNEDKIIATALRCLEERMSYKTDKKFLSSSTVKDYLRLQLSPEKNEVFAVIFMDNHHRLLAFEKLFNGTVNEAVVYPRSVIQKAMHYNAAVIIVAHNHPSGVALPSEADKKLTSDLKRILDIINVKMIDHIVVTCQETYSFAENGLI